MQERHLTCPQGDCHEYSYSVRLNEAHVFQLALGYSDKRQGLSEPFQVAMIDGNKHAKHAHICCVNFFFGLLVVVVVVVGVLLPAPHGNRATQINKQSNLCTPLCELILCSEKRRGHLGGPLLSPGLKRRSGRTLWEGLVTLHSSLPRGTKHYCLSPTFETAR